MAASSPLLPLELSKPLPENMRFVKISFVCQVYKTLVFQVKAHLPIRRVVDRYFSIASVDRGTVDLIYNGERLNLQRTPYELGMEDNATIEAMMRVHGGGN